MLRKLALGALAASCAMLAVTAPPKPVEATNTERVDFPAGGLLRIDNSIGTLTVTGWDQPQVEVTTVKSTKESYLENRQGEGAAELDKVRVKAERKGDEVVVATEFPRHRDFPPGNPFGRGVNVDLQYQIHVPRDARLIISHHDVGEVEVDDLTNDIDVNLLQGEVLLHLPQDAQYAISAKVDFGHVNCDYPGVQKRRGWFAGHEWIGENPGAGAHKLNLKVGYGDVVILKTQLPMHPPSLLPRPSESGASKGL